MTRSFAPSALVLSAFCASCVVVSDDDGDSTAGTSAASSTGVDASTSGASTTTAGSGSSDSDPTSSTTGGSTTSSGTTADASTGGSTGGGTSDSSDSGSMGGGTIDVTLSGCTVDLGGTVVVSYNGSLGVASIYDNGGTLSGSFQFDLTGTGAMTLSSQHRVDTGNVINLVDPAQGTWTNLDSDALSGGTDSISGTLTVTTWNPSAGESLLEFDAVTLQSVVDQSDCTVDGTIETTELYP